MSKNHMILHAYITHHGGHVHQLHKHINNYNCAIRTMRERFHHSKKLLVTSIGQSCVSILTVQALRSDMSFIIQNCYQRENCYRQLTTSKFMT